MSTPARDYARKRMASLAGSGDWTHASEIQAAHLEGQLHAMRECASAGVPAARSRAMVELLVRAENLLRDLPLSLARQQELARWREGYAILLRAGD